MSQQGFIAAYLPFWVVTYFLALTAWGCLARFAMQFFFPPDHPNYIWRGFRLLTGWAVAAARFAVPSYVLPAMLPLVAACWLFALRLVFGLAMISAGLAPTLQAPAP
jgi:hypothetical protein